MRPGNGVGTRILASLCGAALAGACWPVFRQPEVRLETVRLSGLGLDGATLIASLVVSNPNPFELRALSLSYDLDLSDPVAGSNGWVGLATGVIDREYRIGARDSTTVELPLEVSYSGVGNAIRSILEDGTFEYRVGGEIMLAQPVSRRVPFRRQGSISLLSRN